MVRSGQLFRAVTGILAGLLLGALSGSTAGSHDSGVKPGDRAAITQLAARWCAAAAAHDGASLALLSHASHAYYPKLKRLALYADAETLQQQEPIEQLQAMFLRLMLEPDQLQAMDGQQLLAFALERGLIGQDLRRSDALRELVVTKDSAQGRLYKFGRDDSPDRGRQYFVREGGAWRIELRGELERLHTDFAAFLERSGLTASEAAFFILETRLMRKVTPEDFVPPFAAQAPQGLAPAQTAAGAAPPQRTPEPILRVVAISHELDPAGESTVTIEDRVESLRYILRSGDTLPPYPRYTVARIDDDAAVLATADGEHVLRLDRNGEPLNQRLRLPRSAGTQYEKSLLQQAEAGSAREGMMSQWRNVGLRDRPQLLQQGWLTAEYAEPGAQNRSMTGLRVSALVAGSFWQQLGMQKGDLLVEVNGLRVDSMDAWQKVIEMAQEDLAITITVERSAREHRYRTETIRPGSSTIHQPPSPNS